ncbi:transposase [Lewinella sp. W8]|uniref:transposase n=1 Tax=Lewinella sp. W8 TaxID=2528208 RepID=UPI0010685E0F|nr:transposase [Lewinella sp. W8]MTB51696.1 transposase [Lewinella sp. W8]
MKKNRFSETQIITALKRNEQGVSVSDLARELGVSAGTIYNWRQKYSGMESSELKRLKELEEENRKLKQLFADQALQITMLKDALGKKW